jgi:hypothetical protein
MESTVGSVMRIFASIAWMVDHICILFLVLFLEVLIISSKPSPFLQKALITSTIHIWNISTTRQYYLLPVRRHPPGGFLLSSLPSASIRRHGLARAAANGGGVYLSRTASSRRPWPVLRCGGTGRARGGDAEGMRWRVLCGECPAARGRAWRLGSI